LRATGPGPLASRREYRRERVAEELRALLADGAARSKARECARTIAQEDGVGAACAALEGLLRP
jgi:UDP:flavonoid glycosyltransferase YjiC (YdhE family)